jgi:hypothetical protein
LGEGFGGDFLLFLFHNICINQTFPIFFNHYKTPLD